MNCAELVGSFGSTPQDLNELLDIPGVIEALVLIPKPGSQQREPLDRKQIQGLLYERLRKTIEYFHADRLHYAVVGTPNRLEYDQGFFVKNGDGSADVKPIAHLYKSQVYAMARHLGVPERVTSATPTTDTYSLAQGQDEFYFALPYAQMDLALWALNHDRPAGELAEALGVTPAQAQAVYDDIAAKRRTTAYLHRPPVLVEPMTEAHGH